MELGIMRFMEQEDAERLLKEIKKGGRCYFS